MRRQALGLAPLLVAAAQAFSASSCADAQQGDCLFVTGGHGPSGEVDIEVETVASGLVVPWAIAFLPEGDLLVTERPGRLRLVDDGALVEEPVATFEVEGGEGGLLGLALAPDFEASRAFFLYRTVQGEGGPENRVDRFVLAEDRRSATLDAPILEGIPGAATHDGGRLRIGPDGLLWISTGDARRPDLSRNEASLAGKLLRVSVDGAPPEEGPFDDERLVLVGLRNPQGFDWLDPDTLVVVDHGPSGENLERGRDELDVARPGDDLGWPEATGCDAEEGVTSPVISWEQALPPGGVAIYDGDAIPAWRGSILVPALGARRLVRVVLNEARSRVVSHESYLEGTHGRLREAAVGPDGALYLTTSNCDGRGECPPEGDRILRITR